MNRAFTLFEILLVLFAVIGIGALTIPVGVNFYRAQTLDETTGDILLALRRAHAQASFQKNDSDFGVKFLPGSFVIFQGSSYGTRVPSEDEVFSLPAGTITSGIGEVVFGKLKGAPSVTGTVTVSSGGSSEGLSVNQAGKVERL